jgi:hypothetical protein
MHNNKAYGFRLKTGEELRRSIEAMVKERLMNSKEEKMELLNGKHCR